MTGTSPYSGAPYAAQPATGSGSSFADLPAVDSAELAAEPFSASLPAPASAELAAEIVTSGAQLNGPAAAELAADAIRATLTAATAAELAAEPVALALPAAAAAELAASGIGRPEFDTFRPLILSADLIFGPGSATWKTISMTAVSGKAAGNITTVEGIS